MTPWSEIEKRHFSPKQIRRARARARRMILVQFFRFEEDGPWIVLVRGPRGTNVHAHGETIAMAPSPRRRARTELAAVVGNARSAELWRDRAETMPAGAEEWAQRTRVRLAPCLGIHSWPTSPSTDSPGTV